MPLDALLEHSTRLEEELQELWDAHCAVVAALLEEASGAGRAEIRPRTSTEFAAAVLDLLAASRETAGSTTDALQGLPLALLPEGCDSGTARRRCVIEPPRSRLGPYRLQRMLGRGGQGQVYLAEDTRRLQQVALKLLTPSLNVSEDTLRRFRREAEIASRLDHPGMCCVYDAGEVRGIHYIAMRYIDGESLAAKIRFAVERSRARQDALPSTLLLPPACSSQNGSAAGKSSQCSAARAEIDRVVELIEDVAKTLHALHEAGLIHRDVKPSNIMVTPSGAPVLLDFGLALSVELAQGCLTGPGDVLGTPPYMPPEQLQPDQGRLDRRSDVYSLAVTLYECLTLSLPFEAPTREALRRKILEDEPPDPRLKNPLVTAEVSQVLGTALRKDRERRHPTALAFADDLRRARHGGWSRAFAAVDAESPRSRQGR
jgi:hypothetical protein